MAAHSASTIPARVKHFRDSPEFADLLRSKFRLEGERVIRISNGKSVSENRRSSRGYMQVGIVARTLQGKGVNIEHHRLKFFLAHGWLPESVDHRDRDTRNDMLSNLRAATWKDQQRNQPRRARKYDLPRGVYPAASGPRFQVQLLLDGKLRHIGMFDTPEEASRVAEAILRKAHGEFYAA